MASEVWFSAITHMQYLVFRSTKVRTTGSFSFLLPTTASISYHINLPMTELNPILYRLGAFLNACAENTLVLTHFLGLYMASELFWKVEIFYFQQSHIHIIVSGFSANCTAPREFSTCNRTPRASVKRPAVVTKVLLNIPNEVCDAKTAILFPA